MHGLLLGSIFGVCPCSLCSCISSLFVRNALSAATYTNAHLPVRGKSSVQNATIVFGASGQGSQQWEWSETGML